MNIKKFLFGDIKYEKTNNEQKSKFYFSLKGGLLPNLILILLIIILIYWIMQVIA